MCDHLGRHHDGFPLDQLELLILADDAGFDHAADVLDGERPARETFGGGSGSDVHGRLCFHIIIIIAHVAAGCDAIAARRRRGVRLQPPTFAPHARRIALATGWLFGSLNKLLYHNSPIFARQQAYRQRAFGSGEFSLTGAFDPSWTVPSPHRRSMAGWSSRGSERSDYDARDL